MEEALVKCLKQLISVIVCSSADVSSEVIIDTFLSRAKLCLSPASRQELIDWLESYQ